MRLAVSDPMRRTARSAADATLCCLVLAVVALTGSPAAAVENGASPPAAELLLFEEPVVSAASKHEQHVRDAPSAVTVITREDIRRFGYRTLAEALRSVRGFYGSYDRTYSYIGVRGFLRPGDYNDRILLLVNGHVYNDDIFQTALLGNEFGIDLEAIDHIEVIRGPGSALYGGNALFAVINVVTLTAEQAANAAVLAETGSFGRKRGEVRGGHVFDNGVQIFSSGSILDLDGHEDLFFPEFNTPETHNGVAHRADGETAFNYFLSGRSGNLTFQGGVNRRLKHIPTGAFDTTFNDRDTQVVDGRQFAEVAYTRTPLPNLELTGRAFYDGVYYNGTYIFGSGAERVKNKDLASSQWFGGELRGRWDLRADNSLTAGAEFTYHPAARQENFDRGGERFLDDERSFDTWGLYAQDEWRLLPSLTLVAGLRFDSYYSRLREVSPRLAAIWSPRPRTNLKLLFGRAFRPPNLFEQYYDVATGLASLANPDLDSETITTYEAVLEQGLGRGIEAIVALYRYDIDDLIAQTTVVDQSDGEEKLQYRNINSVSAEGAEFEVRVPLPRGIAARVSYAVQQARSQGRILSNSPKHLGYTGVLFPLPYGADGAAELQVVGPRRTLAGRTIDTAAVLNANFRTPVIHGFRFTGGVYNLLDQRYFDPAGADLRQDRIRQDGMTFRVQLEYAF